MPDLLRLPLQAIAYAALGVLLGYCATEPRYQYAAPELASVKVSFSHAAERVEPCVQLTPGEMAELAANMRTTEVCERERLPLSFELDLGDRTLVSLAAEPSGLWNDGPASVYVRRAVEPGRYAVTARLRDSDRAAGWDYSKTETVELEAGRYFTITFRAETGGFEFR